MQIFFIRNRVWDYVDEYTINLLNRSCHCSYCALHTQLYSFIHIVLAICLSVTLDQNRELISIPIILSGSQAHTHSHIYECMTCRFSNHLIFQNSFQVNFAAFENYAISRRYGRIFQIGHQPFFINSVQISSFELIQTKTSSWLMNGLTYMFVIAAQVIHI